MNHDRISTPKLYLHDFDHGFYTTVPSQGSKRVTPDSSCGDIGRDLDVLLADIETNLGVDKRSGTTTGRGASMQTESVYDAPGDQAVDENAM